MSNFVVVGGGAAGLEMVTRLASSFAGKSDHTVTWLSHLLITYGNQDCMKLRRARLIMSSIRLRFVFMLLVTATSMFKLECLV